MVQETIDVSPYELDHVCYRVETEDEYRKSYQYLTEKGLLLVEQPVGGRLIATFKLHEQIIIPEFSKSVSVIELPLPKIGSFYPSGFEHVEFVVPTPLLQFANKYPSVKWDKSGLNKDSNQDIRLELIKKKLNVKFHNLSLEKVIELEKQKNSL